MNKFKKAHSMAKTIKKLYPDVDYMFQFALCLKFLYGKPLPEGRKEEAAKVSESFEMVNGKITPKALIHELGKAKVDGVSIKINWYSKRMTQRVYVAAFIKGKRYDAGYIEYATMRYRPTSLTTDPDILLKVDSAIERQLSIICDAMPWRCMYA